MPGGQRLADDEGAGAPVLVSAACPLNPMAAAACTEAFVEAAARGESLVGAMIHGRRAVRALLQPHPDSRPYSLQLRVADLSVLDQFMDEDEYQDLIG